MSKTLPYDFLGNEFSGAGNLETDLQYLLSLSGVGGTSSLGVVISVFDDDEPIVVGDGITGIPITDLLDKTNLINAVAIVHTKGTSGTTNIQIRRVRNGASVDMLSTEITIDTTEYYASDGVIDINNDDVMIGDMLYIDIDAISTGVAGLSIGLTFGGQ